MSGSSMKALVGNATKATELKIGAPSDFDGDQKNAMSWLYSVQTYLLVNEELYDTDTKRVVYTLSYMKKGVTHSWATTFQKTSLEKNPPSFGTFADFVKDFKNSFTSPDTASTAITKLHTMKQKESVEQYITDFQTAAANSTITEDVALIEFFSQGLKPFITNRIHMMETTPTKITNWYTQAQKFDAKWRKVNKFSRKKEKRTFHPRNSFSEEKDPNTMDVDGVRLSKEERDHHIKEGRCFSCGNKGHLSRECPDKGKTPQKKVKKIHKIVEVEESDDEEKVAGPSVALVNIARALGKEVPQTKDSLVSVAPVLVSSTPEHTMQIPISLYASETTLKVVNTTTLVDSGAEISCIDWAFNADGTQNSKGRILFSATLYFKVKGLVHQSFFHVINCGTENVILGLPWLQENNPIVDWRMGTLSIDEKTDRSKELRRNISSIAVEELTVNLVTPTEKKGINKFIDYKEPEDKTICSHFVMSVGKLVGEAKKINPNNNLLRKITMATELAQEEHKKKPKPVLPKDYKDFASVFDKPSDGILPPS
ncbi:hypothetical protein M404DRAFT_31064 [Pisolithus tinctorius Marx 270]|uniref:CCHC-type domain-containing protein n=1 Tax=Pisolithus tinctorius Marx 270 TaxID=870435 RepID=A0A0C3IP42_PISTI|nr:hypothetical protein M404DRAFT_31064 [Pisolithus tinctorius Marx 270]